MITRPNLQNKTDRPRFTGVSLYNHARRQLSFWYPTEWHLQKTDPPQNEAEPITVTLLPNPQDPTTNITIEMKDLGQPLAVDERQFIESGVKEGLAQLEDCVIERWRQLTETEVGDWGLEWICYFTDTGQRRKRRARLFFSDRYLYSVICQGSTEADYAYWQGMFEFVLLTVGANQFSVTDWRKEQDGSGFIT